MGRRDLTLQNRYAGPEPFERLSSFWAAIGCAVPRSSGKSRRRVEKIGDGPSDGHDTQPAINVTASCEQKVRPPTTAALLVKLDYNAKAEKRLAGVVCNFHPPFRTSFNWII